MTRTSRDRKIIFVLLIALGVELFLLLAHTGVIQIGGKSASTGVAAGHVAKAHNHLRRRNVNSLVWETSQTHEPLYFHDAVLTLKESTATLELETSTEVTLSENTLITIEPPDDLHTGEIRLRFLRGNLQARNPFQASSIEGDAWSMNLKSGSEVELREVGDRGVEVRLKGGEGVLKAADGMKNLKANEILRLSKSGAAKIALDSSLTWTNTPPRRIYLHGEAVPLQLEWEGGPSQLLIQTLGHEEQILNLAHGQKSILTDLPYGHHRLYLRSGTSSSAALDVQVWRAPLIHLLAPLPRNRAELNTPVTFLWQKSPQVEAFNLKMNGSAVKMSERQPANILTRTFTQEEDVQWYVEGLDTDGFVVPPLYRYPLFIRERPFAAPKLKLPQLRQPATVKPPGPGAWLWSWVMPAAQAEEKTKFEAVFSWEPVPGANQYVIEISESADFRNPIVNAVLKTTEFTWEGFFLQAYYWRVAAGHSKGRMGVFSDPVGVDFSPLKKNINIAALDGVLIRKIVQAALAAVPKHTPTNSAPSTAKTAVVPAPITAPPEKRGVELTEAQKNWRPILLWQPHYGVIQVTGTEDTEANLSGATMMAFGLEYPWRDSDGALWLFDLSINYFSFKPEPKETFPFQQDLRWLEFDASFARFRSGLGYGFSARQMLSLRRTDYEAVTGDTALGFGPIAQQNLPLLRGELNLRLQVTFSRDGQAVVATPEWRARIGPRMVTGIGVEGIMLIDIPDIGYSIQGFATLGFPF